MSDKQTDTALAGSVFLGLIGLICLGVGVSIEFGGGWAAIVVGAVLFMYSLVVAFSRRSQTLYYPDNTTSLRK